MKIIIKTNHSFTVHSVSACENVNWHYTFFSTDKGKDKHGLLLTQIPSESKTFIYPVH